MGPFFTSLHFLMLSTFTFSSLTMDYFPLLGDRTCDAFSVSILIYSQYFSEHLMSISESSIGADHSIVCLSPILFFLLTLDTTSIPKSLSHVNYVNMLPTR